MSSGNETIYIFKSKPQKNFTTSCNEMVEDRRLSASARLMLVYLTGRPKDWRTRMKQVCEVCCLGRDSGYKRMKELIDVGYVERRYSGPAGPKRKVEYFVFDSVAACTAFKEARQESKGKKSKPVDGPARDANGRISVFHGSADDVADGVDSGKAGNYNVGNHFSGSIQKTDRDQRLKEDQESNLSPLLPHTSAHARDDGGNGALYARQDEVHRDPERNPVPCGDIARRQKTSQPDGLNHATRSTPAARHADVGAYFDAYDAAVQSHGIPPAIRSEGRRRAMKKIAHAYPFDQWQVSMLCLDRALKHVPPERITWSHAKISIDWVIGRTVEDSRVEELMDLGCDQPDSDDLLHMVRALPDALPMTA